MTQIDIFARFAPCYVEYGFSVFPCTERGKLPKTKNGFKDASQDYATIASWATSHPQANIGIATGETSGIWVLDLDGEDAEQWLADQQKEHGELPITPEVKTGKGRHIYFKMETGLTINNSANQVGPHVDVRGNGGYVIAPPSAHPDGGAYQWHSEFKPSTTPFADAPKWLLDKVIKKAPEPRATIITPKTSDSSNADRYVKRVFDEEFRLLATCPQGGRNHQLFKSTAAMANYIGQGGATESMVRSLATAGAQACGLWGDDPSACESTIDSALRTGLTNHKDVPEPKQSYAEKPALSIVSDTDHADNDWKSGLLYNDRGVIKKSFHNGFATLEQHPAMRGVLIYNAFTDLVMLIECPPWEKIEGWRSRPIRDDDATACTSWLETPEAGGLSIRPNDAYAIMLRIAKKHEIDPPKEWLEALKWDGIERISKWLIDHCEAADNAYTETVSRKFLIGAVKRLMEPGCKMDSMLILEGEQGKGKSTALRILATWGDDCYFTDQVDDISNKDALIQIQGVSIIEFAEMDTLNKSDTDHIKKFITRQIDRYRPPYGRTLTDRPRRCVFAGTVNPGGNGYLKDPTGARRFWPVAVGHIDIADFAKVVPQLWAEAYVAWQQGEKNWIDDPEVIKMATEEQATRYEEEPWANIIEEELQYVDAVTVQDLMTLIDIPKERRDRRASLRIGSYLRHRKWIARKDYRPDSGSKNPQRRFYAPEGHTTIPRPPKAQWGDTNYEY